MALHPQHWLRPMPGGLYCEPGGFFIDPSRPVDRAIVTHGHGDHARAGHGKVAATAETLAIMGVRYGEREWKATIEGLIEKHKAAIDQILRDYGVPLLDNEAPATARQ